MGMPTNSPGSEGEVFAWKRRGGGEGGLCFVVFAEVGGKGWMDGAGSWGAFESGRVRLWGYYGEGYYV